MGILIETSARHVHLSRAHVEALFGAGHKLTPKKELSQPGQYACEERIRLEGPKGASQVEVSLTDARTLGITAPVRESGDVAGSGACKLIGPAGEVELTEGVIAAKRHIHVAAADAEKLGVKDKDVVSVRCGAEGRKLVFDDVFIRVSDKFNTGMHIDTDEANAAGITGNTEGEIVR